MTSFLRLRHRLLPYLHTMNHRARREACRSSQPHVLVAPGAAEAYEVPNQFLFGSELLVAPITTPARPGTLPWAGARLAAAGQLVGRAVPGWATTGGRELLLHRDLTTIPVLARAGAIVPLDAAEVPANGAGQPCALEVLVVVGADGTFEIVEDDGTGTGTAVAPRSRSRSATGTVTPGPRPARGLPAGRRTWTVTFLGIRRHAGGPRRRRPR